jgi:hypothetical protein
MYRMLSELILQFTKEADLYYPAGPPYLATGKDMYAIAKHWVQFLPRVHDIFTGFMAEMHAYSTAAAHLGLPHQLTSGFMASDVGNKGMEKFEFLDNVTRTDACHRDLMGEGHKGRFTSSFALLSTVFIRSVVFQQIQATRGLLHL